MSIVYNGTSHLESDAISGVKRPLHDEADDRRKRQRTGINFSDEEVPIRASTQTEVPSNATKPFLNLDRIKVMLFSVGRRVHRSRGYEHLFSEYWNALILRLDGRISLASASRCKAIVDRFLSTKTLRKLHNRLIMGEYETTRWVCTIGRKV